MNSSNASIQRSSLERVFIVFATNIVKIEFHEPCSTTTLPLEIFIQFVRCLRIHFFRFLLFILFGFFKLNNLTYTTMFIAEASFRS